MIPFDLASWAETAVGGSMALALPVALFAGLWPFSRPAWCRYCRATSRMRPVWEPPRSSRDRPAGADACRRIALRAGIRGGLRRDRRRRRIRRAAAGRVSRCDHSSAWRVDHCSWSDLRGRAADRPTGSTDPSHSGGRRSSGTLVGVVFALGWTPCLSPTLGVVVNLGFNEGTAARGGLLGFVYALGLGIPFVVAGSPSPRWPPRSPSSGSANS